MTASAYDPQSSLRDARALYFDDNGFPGGGYDARWAKVEIGPVPIWFPNSKMRVRALRVHDLHHVVTGYATNLVGEGEIGAWEVASGCRREWVAWVLNLQALALGSVLSLERVRTAFVRGRHTRNLYGHSFDDALLARSVSDVRAELGLEESVPEATTADRRALLGWLALGWALNLGALGLFLSPLLVAAAWWLWRSRM